MTEEKWFTYAEAAKRVKRCHRTIRRWHSIGMPMEWKIIEGQRTRVVREDILLAFFRQTLQNSPVHQYRLRAQGLPNTAPGNRL
ncbi:hypothetical protein [Microbacterium sp. 179-I 3D4 NHS]|uniref:hypothetical protein n=1 Tax=Microbacterium sp. 179-I 3D4 NHS TaxID=3142381 RepID=UPI00399FE5EE